jgi:uncharacterized membrane protein
MNMDTIRFCPQCQQPLPANAPEGLCPQCLLRQAVPPIPSSVPAADISHQIRTGVWGSVGPVLIMLLVALLFGPFRPANYGEGLQARFMAAVNNVGNLWFVIFLEGVVGFIYGFIRSGRSPSNWWQGVLNGSLVWACLALPLAGVGMLAVFFSGASPHGGQSSTEGLAYILGLYFTQVVCGAVAGFLVETHRKQMSQSHSQPLNPHP